MSRIREEVRQLVIGISKIDKIAVPQRAEIAVNIGEAAEFPPTGRWQDTI